MNPRPKTPILDKFSLHPFGGYCTCFSDPCSPCSICTQAKAQAKRWENLSAKDRKKAEQEMDEAYPRTSNQDGR